MKSLPPPPMVLFATGEEKCDGLRAFIEEALNDSDLDQTDVRLIARSATSPIARALVAHGHRLARQNAKIHAIFGELGAERTFDGWTLAGPHLPFVSEVRHMAQRGYFDVHEQLIIGRKHVWYGDSLRRDPAKRDALSLFNRNCVQAARMAGNTFDQFWGLSHALLATQGARGVGAALGSVDMTVVAVSAVPDVTPPSMPGAETLDVPAELIALAEAKSRTSRH